MAEEKDKEEEKKEERRKKINDLDERSDQVKEILGQAPNWVIQWGISVVFIIVVLFVVGSALISYPDIIPARVIITSENSPAHINAKTNGKLIKVSVESEQEVTEGQVLAVIENTANFEDVQLIKEKIKDFEPKIDDFDSLKYKFPSNLKLGTIQTVYNTFRRQYREFLNYNKHTPEKSQVLGLSSQIRAARQRLTNSEIALSQNKLELDNARREYNSIKRLVDDDIEAPINLQNAETSLARAQQAYKNAESTVQSNKSNLASLNTSLGQAQIGDETSLFSTDQNLEEAKQNLENQILQWEQQFVLQSPINGKVTFFDVWSQHQNVTLGQRIFTVIPSNKGKIIGRVSIPVQNSGKVKKGQQVLIKLTNYPYQEWGSLAGEITDISAVPMQSPQGGPASYAAYLKIDSLSSSFDKTIEFRQEMEGTAEIVVEELTVMQRIFYQLREVFSRK